MNLKAKNTFEQNVNNNHTFAHINFFFTNFKKKILLIIHTKILLIFKKNYAHLIRKFFFIYNNVLVTKKLLDQGFSIGIYQVTKCIANTKINNPNHYIFFVIFQMHKDTIF
jgi:hypothetical protein